jgi:hypothetical protein
VFVVEMTGGMEWQKVVSLTKHHRESDATHLDFSLAGQKSSCKVKNPREIALSNLNL